MAYTTIDDPELYFQVKTWTGNGSTQSITLDGDENMQPDWVWIKNRGATASHILTDVIRGVTKNLFSDKTETEETISTRITSFDSDGFSLGSEANVNASSNTYVAWNWKAGGSASSNSDGSITSSVSANTTAGFSIVTYTGTGSAATVGHGLGAVPAWYFIKKRNSSTGSNWIVYHESISGTGDGHIWLDLNNERGTDTNSWNNTAPTSSVFSIGTRTENNNNTDTFIAYCFAEKKGYSKFGSYTGNGASQNFIYTGFKPAWVLFKKSSGTNHWNLYDNKRNTFNPESNLLYPSLSDAEASFSGVDFVSNGISIKTNNTNFNDSGGTYIYMAFAESPLVNSNGVPTNAR